MRKADWGFVSGGDGMQCYFDPKDDRRYYSSIYYGSITRFFNDGQSSNNNATSILSRWSVQQLFGVVDSGA
jgi:hypothetical protein